MLKIRIRNFRYRHGVYRKCKYTIRLEELRCGKTKRRKDSRLKQEGVNRTLGKVGVNE